MSCGTSDRAINLDSLLGDFGDQPPLTSDLQGLGRYKK